ncbi:MATE family efflux transporter [Pseudoxanthomonas broegbernensis]|uniref:Multidrug-efflux transporter n=1 Tax=Pseudoxanthomonas broegbernensis TaxID=83619 RepID=A0A7V8GNM9_9GAMM|nr:MATE family efflux transporter [Pseudoxanthomonas broegbernensis]KAF1687137.1 MATE family efflux transporter [Pseudoxanthomonas broegbernensis]MBB6065887.1 MATE family multidrug resistance protein [Pseudoxanthomonas broegbernensis]
MNPPAPPAPRLRHELRATATLGLPLVLGHVSTGLINFVDNVIAGHHGTRTLASVTVGTALLWLPMMVPIGTLIALTASVSQLDGAGRRHEIAPLFRQALWLGLGLGALMFAFLSAVPLALGAFGIAPDIVPGAVAFAHAVRWGVPALILFFCMRYLSEGLHWTLPTMLLGFGGLAVLAPLGGALTFGAGPLPEMGAAGLGAASATVMWLQALAFAAYLARSRRFAPLALFARLEAPRPRVIGALLATGLPIGITVLMEGGLFIVTALLIARLGEVPAAAHQIAINVAALCFMVPMGLAEATTVRVGRALGSGDPDGVRRAARAGYVIVLATQTLSALLLLLGHDAIVAVYTRDAAVAALASVLLLYAAAFQFPDGIQVMSAGALRGLRDTRVPMFLAMASYWGLGMPLGAWLGLGLGGGPQGMWAGLTVGLAAAAVLMGWRLAYSLRRLPAPVPMPGPAPSGTVTSGA